MQVELIQLVLRRAGHPPFGSLENLQRTFAKGLVSGVWVRRLSVEVVLLFLAYYSQKVLYGVIVVLHCVSFRSAGVVLFFITIGVSPSDVVLHAEEDFVIFRCQLVWFRLKRNKQPT